MRYVFKKHRDPDNKFDNSDVEIDFEAVDRVEILENFLDFLSGCGYNVEDWKREFLYGEISGEGDE